MMDIYMIESALSVHRKYADGFHNTFYSLELSCDEVKPIVQVAFWRHLLQVGVAVLILVH